MIKKIAVLLGIEDLEEGRSGIAVKTGADLVDLIEHDHRVGSLAGFDGLNEFAGHRPDIGAAMTLYLRLVTHPAQGKAEEFTAETGCHGPAD